MTRFAPRALASGATAARAHHPQAREPLTDQRFHSLLSAAGAFFASFDRDVEAEKAAAVVEILALMQRYGLSAEDVAPDQSPVPGKNTMPVRFTSSR